MIELKCKTCGEQFEVHLYRKTTAKYCSVKCKCIDFRGVAPWNKGTANKDKIFCKICKKEFLRYPSRKAIFCSPKCQAIDRVGIKRPDVSKRMIGNTYCLGRKRPEEEIEKIRIANLGEKCPFWKGGRMKDYPELEQIRKSPEYNKWRTLIYTRDDYNCLMPECEKRGGKMVAHHIKRFRDYPKLRLISNNGITLCKECHQEVKGKEKQYEVLFSDIIS